MTPVNEMLTIVTALSDEEVRKIIAEQLSPLALLKQAVVTYWMALGFSAVSFVMSVWRKPHGERRGLRFRGVADWSTIPYFAWGVVAVWPRTLSYLFPPIFYFIHCLTAVTALWILLASSAVSTVFMRVSNLDNRARHPQWHPLVVSIVIATVFMDFLFWAALTTPFRRQ